MISLCTFVKNEEACIARMFESVRSYVQEIVVVDTGSTDTTLDICRAEGARIYQAGFTDFAKIRTMAAHLARMDWVLMLDADETLEYPWLLKDLYGSNAYAFPRKRWLDLDMTNQTELDAYPDYQVRFFRNDPRYVFIRPLHEYFHGTSVKHIPDGPTINHFHDVWKTPQRLEERNELYTRLALQAGVSIEGGKPV